MGLLDWTLTFAAVFLLLSLYHALLSRVCIVRMYRLNLLYVYNAVNFPFARASSMLYAPFMRSRSTWPSNARSGNSIRTPLASGQAYPRASIFLQYAT